MFFGGEFKVGKKKASEILKKLKDKGKESFEVEAFRILEFYGVDVPEYQVARSKVDIYYIIEDIGLPVVLKAVASSAVHREDLEAVVVVSSKEDVDSAYPKALGEIVSNLPWLTLESILVQKFVPSSEKHTFIFERENKKDKGTVKVDGALGGKIDEVSFDDYPYVLPVVAFFKDFQDDVKILEVDFVRSENDGRWYLVDAKCYLLT
ncbi:MAG: acetate--CoA ligase family protein [Thermosulfidibacteraceae bacterium]|jgi:acyl-CoA synthetase (NDP forming)